MAHDEMEELEKTVDYEPFMKECLTCESVYKSKISTPEIPGLPEGLFDLVEQTTLTRATATLSMIAILEKVADEQEARKKLRKTQIVERHVRDEAVRIVESGCRRQSSKFAEKRIEPERHGQR